MATVTKIDQYEVMYSANKFPPRIWLYGGGKPLGQLLFMPDGTALPQDAMSNNQVNLYYHLENLETMITLFRGDKTLYLLWAGSGPGFENGIQTAQHILGT
jgi:hypothetical protein